MQKIASFCVDHNKIVPGMYISRIDDDIITDEESKELIKFIKYILYTDEFSERFTQHIKDEIKSLKEELEKTRELQKIPVTLPNGKSLDLSFGEHNTLQKAIIEVFLPLFGFGAEVLYVGDTNNKFLYIEEEKLKELNFFTLEHEELPDVIAYSKEKNLLYLIEAYHSTGEWNSC